MPPFPNFCDASYTSQSPIAAQERTVNFYPEFVETAGAKARMVLYPTPGVEEFTTFATSPGRVFFAENARCFAVVGDKFVELGSDGTKNVRGTVSVNLGTEPATVSSNGDLGRQLFITSNNHGYSYDLDAHTFTEHFASGAVMCDHIDGYFLLLDASISKLSASSYGDGTTWDALAFTQRSAQNDRWRCLKVVGQDVWLLGDETSEAWYNAGLTPFPFTLNKSSVIPFGVAAGWSAKVVAGSLIWLARTRHGYGQVVQLSGYTPRVISTHAVETAIRGYLETAGTVADARGDTIEIDGHVFYILTFPTADATWAYDLRTEKWIELGTWNVETARYTAWRPLYHAFVFNKHLMLDRSTGSVWEVSPSFTTDVDGSFIRRLRRAPTLWHPDSRLYFRSFELDCEVGLGAVSGPGADPTAELRYSDDGGKTWQTAGSEYVGTGALGEFETRVQWRRLGSSRKGRVFEVVMGSPIPWRLIGAYLNN